MDFCGECLSSPVIKYIVSLRKRFIYSGWKAVKGYAKQAQNNSGEERRRVPHYAGYKKVLEE